MIATRQRPQREGGYSGAVQDGLRALEQAALPTSKEWAYWWNEKTRFIEMTYGWERALIDATTRLVRNNLTLARMIRLENEAKKVIQYDSDGHVWGEGFKDPAEFTREALVWFLTVINPRATDAPPWARFLFKAAEGCYIQQARIGLELSGVKKRGYLTLNHSATAVNPQAFDERFIETL